MMLIKVFPIFLIVALSACSSLREENDARKATLVQSERTIVYSCNKATVKAIYSFQGQEPVEAKIVLGNKLLAESLEYDFTKKGFTSFISDQYIWNVDAGLTLNKVAAVDAVTLIQRGKKSSKVLAKNCFINFK
ncbi:MAG: hypothetical protein ACLTK3_02680, partial [Haemophilus parainfluenzae]